MATAEKGRFASTEGNESVFTLDSYDDPEIVAHERIHVGQDRLGISHSDPEVVRIFGKPYNAEKEYSNAHEAWHEYPAYDLASSAEPDPDRIKRAQEYTNRLRSKGAYDRGISSIEVSLREPMRSRYLEQLAPTIRPVAAPQMHEFSVEEWEAAHRKSDARKARLAKTLKGLQGR